VTGVVVGVSRTTTSGSAVRWAGAEAATRGSTLTLVHAWDAPLDLSVDLEAGSLPDLLGAVTSRAKPGPAAEVLLGLQPELLVLGGGRGARHLSRVTRACLHRAACPVVVVPDVEYRPIRRVAVGVNGSAASGAALAWAAHEAQLQGATLVVLYAWQMHPTSPQQVLRPSHALAGQQGAAFERLRDWVQAQRAIVAVELLAIHGGPLDGLLEVGLHADLLVLGRAAAPSGFGRLLHGTVGDDLVALAPCPVASVPGSATHRTDGPHRSVHSS
jgi:nucleotide-binding universal stress UspA family protein